MDLREKAIHYAHENAGKYLSDLQELVRIPSISTNVENTADIRTAAEWLKSELKTRGCTRIEIFPTQKHPIVYAEWLGAGANKPTVLVYGHYDVQPVDPIELWKAQPFDAAVEGEYLFGRGASDMKGQIIAVLKAIEAVQSVGKFPVNLKFIFEGEEEIGSPNLPPFIKDHADLLACDFALNPDSGMISADLPTISYGLRGLAYFEIRLYGQEHDLHSGLYGGVVDNPANVLCELVAGMKDKDHRVTLPGFYDKVRLLSDAERAELARLPMDEKFYLEATGARKLAGETGYSWIERTGARPSLDVNGIFSGFIGEGSKTVIPCYAMAKVSTRLVPDQDPEDVHDALVKYIEERIPDTMRYEVLSFSGSPATITDINTRWVKALEKGMETVWGKRPVFKREGGSIPVVGDMKEYLHAESVLTGFGLPDDNIHAPNERMHLPTWYRGIDSLIHFFFNL
jgi:acetylornithine deacetylase/succinyl-diaminopimelate desuccinylase-like protein